MAEGAGSNGRTLAARARAAGKSKVTFSSMSDKQVLQRLRELTTAAKAVTQQRDRLELSRELAKQGAAGQK